MQLINNPVLAIHQVFALSKEVDPANRGLAHRSFMQIYISPAESHTVIDQSNALRPLTSQAKGFLSVIEHGRTSLVLFDFVPRCPVSVNPKTNANVVHSGAKHSCGTVGRKQQVKHTHSVKSTQGRFLSCDSIVFKGLPFGYVRFERMCSPTNLMLVLLGLLGFLLPTRFGGQFPQKKSAIRAMPSASLWYRGLQAEAAKGAGAFFAGLPDELTAEEETKLSQDHDSSSM